MLNITLSLYDDFNLIVNIQFVFNITHHYYKSIYTPESICNYEYFILICNQDYSQ